MRTRAARQPRRSIPPWKNASTMSSATSTSSGVSPEASADRGGDALHPWQFFVLAALGCATVATFLARGQGITAVVLLSVLMAAAGLVGYGALRAVRPLFTGDDDRTAMVGARTRAALEREKMLTLRAIK